MVRSKLQVGSFLENQEDQTTKVQHCCDNLYYFSLTNNNNKNRNHGAPTATNVLHHRPTASTDTFSCTVCHNCGDRSL
jgi:hypothetical protein